MEKEQIVSDETQRYRQLNGSLNSIWKGILFLMPLLGIMYILSIHQYFNIPLFKQQYVGVYLALVLVAIFIGVPAGKNKNQTKVPWYDWGLAAVGLAVGLYVTIFYPSISLQMGLVTTDRLIMSVLAIGVLIEALRRMTGWILVGIVLFFISYALTAPYFPGAFEGRSVSLSNLFNYMYLDSSSLLSMLDIAATVALAFIMFGQVLLNFKGGEIFNNTALSIFGRYKGGAAKASIVGSGMVGSVTGGPVANVMLTGTMTIPLMIRSGFTRVQAGAIESVASTGGSFMPPLMGITAFLIAENLGVPYKEVALAALIPALLYYLSFFLQVHLIADKRNLAGIPKDELPTVKSVLSKIIYIIPIFVIFIYLLFVKGFAPDTAAIYGVGIAIVILSFQKEVRVGFLKRMYNTFIDTGRVLLEIGVILGVAGLIMGVVGVTGLGYNLVLALSSLGNSGLFVLLAASAIVSIILGMGMPGLAAYALVAVLVAPTIVDLGVQPMAAHLFVFYFAMVSSFTPPIALACFAAAPIAGASAQKIGVESSKLGIVAYIVPFLFVFSPAMLLTYQVDYSVSLITFSIVKAVIAISILSISIVGFFKSPISLFSRIVLFILAIALLLPNDDFILMISTFGVGLALIGVKYFLFKKPNKKVIETSVEKAN
ncbi:TRAP transporter fused permease subunit [Bacillus sp. B190/17]|uniref:TRAP transporter fused permease subunit n=1 Tax=Bacillus lumedeiriae TaxID=3058829 RepID=A0ABW8IA72_9BACI